MRFEHVGVVGAGAWGVALANAAARAGRAVTLWGRDSATLAALRRDRQSMRLPGIGLHDRVAVADDLAQTCAADAVLLVVPAQSLREPAGRMRGHIRDGTPVISCAKGIERSTRRFMSEVIADLLPDAEPAVLSGPGFAHDVGQGLPTAVTLAARDGELARALADALGSASFRVYHSTDIRGVEIGGAAKNVLAIAAGIVTGRRLGASAAAALTTRGFAELVRFGRAYGAQPETLMGLSGLGDVLLTCSSRQSRNFSLGVAIGAGATVSSDGPLAEGAFTAAALVAMARARGVEMPVARAVASVLDGSLAVDAATELLLARPQRAEA